MDEEKLKPIHIGLLLHLKFTSFSLPDNSINYQNINTNGGGICHCTMYYYVRMPIQDILTHIN